MQRALAAPPQLSSSGNWDRNHLLNPSYRICQAPVGTSFTIAASTANVSQYNLDQWLTQSVPNGGTSAATVVSRQSFSLGQGVVPNEPINFLRIQNSTIGTNLGASSFHNLIQRIEGVRSLAGETVTLSCWVRSSIANKVLGIYYFQSFGTGGAPSSGVAVQGGNAVLGPNWQKYTLTLAIPSLSGKVLGANGDDFLSLNFVLQGGATLIDPLCKTSGGISWGGTGTVDFANVQLESGNATDFYTRPVDLDLLRCRRYYFFQTTAQHTWLAVSGSYLEGSNFFPVPLRSNPSALRFYANSTTVLGLMNVTNNVVVPNANLFGGSQSGVTEVFCSSNTLTVGNVYYGFIEADARL